MLTQIKYEGRQVAPKSRVLVKTIAPGQRGMLRYSEVGSMRRWGCHAPGAGGAWHPPAQSGIMDNILHVHCMHGVQDQSKADAFEGAEYHQGAGPFIGQGNGIA